MKIIAIIPVMGRPDTIRKTIPRLIRQVDKVIIAGHTEEEAVICKGSDFYICDKDMKVGAKWQFCAERAREDKPDAILIMGSGCMISDNWIDTLSPYLKEYDLVGGRFIYFLDYQPLGKKRMFFWSGYNGERSKEPVGPGRLISSRFLDSNDWSVFNTDINSGLDFSLMRILRVGGGESFVYPGDEVKVMRISSYKYVQKNSYDRLQRTSSARPVSDIDSLLTQYFPDAI